MIHSLRHWYWDSLYKLRMWRYRHVDADHRHIVRQLEHTAQMMRKRKCSLSEWQTGTRIERGQIVDSLSIVTARDPGHEH